jgi:hypothetical protein
LQDLQDLQRSAVEKRNGGGQKKEGSDEALNIKKSLLSTS